jgi:GNAT superfamily N-acetyltransferase
MTWTLYQHSKGMPYLGLGDALHSETKEVLTYYGCLHDNELAQNWVRPTEMFRGVNEQGHQRFTPIGRIRVVEPEDEPQVIAFGYDAWGKGQSLEEFIQSYRENLHHLRGTRYLLEKIDGTPVSNLNVIRFARGVLGIASVATAPAHRGQGHARLLIKAVMNLKRFESGADPRFLLFSEVPAQVYEPCGFRILEEEHQRFKPSVAMATGSAPLTATEAQFLKNYF